MALKQEAINEAMYKGNIQGAYDILNKDSKKWERNRNALLFYWNKGTLASMLGKHKESAELFMKGDYFIEDLYRNYANEAASLFINDKVRQYRGEDHERVLFHYYQIINFLRLGNTENAMVQSRRLQLELQRLDDRYKDKPISSSGRYQRDAFAYVLIGLVYEAVGDEENAFVAYKNAYTIYKEDYTRYFSVNMPDQFKQDLLRLAFKLGNYAELERFEKELGINYDRKESVKGGNAVFFWNTGLSPTKQEVNLSFIILRGNEPGWVIFSNAEFNFLFPVYVGTEHTKSGSSFSQLRMIRATFPKYVNRGALYSDAIVEWNGGAARFQLLQDVSAIAQKELSDRYLEEVGKTLLRVALKKASEIELRKNQPEAGVALGIVNFFTEQADTRCWESMPHQISYARTTLETGKQTVRFVSTVQGYNYVQNAEVNIPARGMEFFSFHTVQPARIVR